MTNTTNAPVADSNTVADYAVADKTTKAAWRTEWKAAIDAAVRNGDINTAMQHMATRDAALATSSASKTTPVDYPAVIAARISTLRLAADMLEMGTIVPDGIDAENAPSAESIGDAIAALDLDAPDTDAATKLAGARVSRSGKRFNVADYVAVVLADHGGVFMTVSELGHGAVDGNAPSGGAISAYLARVDGHDDSNGVTVSNNESGVLGASLDA